MSMDEVLAHLPPTERYAAAARLSYDLARRRRRAAAAEDGREKRCPACGTVKPASAFSADPSRSDGLRGYCRACR